MGCRRREQRDAAGGLPPRPLQPVVERGVFELVQIEAGSVHHQAHAGVVGKQVTEEALDQRRGPGQYLPSEHDTDLEADELP